MKPVARDFVISLAIPLGLELDMESQPLVNLVDLDLPAPDGNYLLETLLRRVDAFHNEWIKEDPFLLAMGSCSDGTLTTLEFME